MEKQNNNNMVGRTGTVIGGTAASIRTLSAKRRRGLLLAAVLLCLLIAVSAIGGLLARYITENRREAEMISAGFHVSSNYLKETTNQVSVATTGEIRVELYNWEVENTAQVAEMDIGYEIEIDGGTLSYVTLNDTATRIQAANGTYTLGRGTAEDGYKTKHVLHIAPTAPTVTVTVKNTTPYRKNGNEGLSAVFTRTVAANPKYTLTQHTAPDVWKLTIKTYGYSGNVKIQCGTGVAPDNTNVSMPSAIWTTEGTGTLTVQDNETYELLFFGTASKQTVWTEILDPGNVGVKIGS